MHLPACQDEEGMYAIGRTGDVTGHILVTISDTKGKR